MWRCTLRNLAQVATMCYGRARGWISHEPVLTARYAANLSGPKGQNFLYSPLPIVPPISWAWWNQCTMEPIYVCVCQTCTVSKFGYMSEKIYCTEPLKARRNMATVVLPIKHLGWLGNILVQSFNPFKTFLLIPVFLTKSCPKPAT